MRRRSYSRPSDQPSRPGPGLREEARPFVYPTAQVLNSSEPVPDDPFLAELIATVRDDPRPSDRCCTDPGPSAGTGRSRTTTFIRIVTAEAYEARRAAGALVEKLTLNGTHKADFLYQTESRIQTYVMEPGWYTPFPFGTDR